MAQTATSRPQTLSGKFVHYARKVYNPLGFHKSYNFPLFVILCGVLAGFSLARMPYLNFNTFMKKAIPGEQYWYRSGYRRVGIMLHLATVLPAGFLVVFQFVPVIRHKVIIVHRINGYLCTLLLILGNVGALMLAKHAVGGGPVMEMFVGVLATMVTGALVLAYINIKTLQIDQHRAWVLRAWVWAASIISLRLIMAAAIVIVAKYHTFYSAISCSEIWYIYQFYTGIPDSANPARFKYPQCTSATSTTYVAVSTRWTGPGSAGPENTAANIRNNFAMAGALAFIIHAFLVELYLGLTPAESARLRMVSYERQLKAGFLKHPEKGGLTSTRLGDAPAGWNSPSDTLPMHEKRLSGDTIRSDSNTDVDQEPQHIKLNDSAV